MEANDEIKKKASEMLSQLGEQAKGIEGIASSLEAVLNLLPENEEQRKIVSDHLTAVRKDLSKIPNIINDAIKG